METKDWVLVLGPLVGVLTGGAITSVAKYIELRFNRNAALRDKHIEMVAEIDEDLRKLSRQFTQNSVAVGVSYENLIFADVQDIVDQWYEDADSVCQRLLIHVHPLGKLGIALSNAASDLKIMFPAKTRAECSGMSQPERAGRARWLLDGFADALTKLKNANLAELQSLVEENKGVLSNILRKVSRSRPKKELRKLD